MTPSYPRKSDEQHPRGRHWPGRVAFLLIAASTLAISGDISAQQTPGDEHCRAPDVENHSSDKQAGPRAEEDASKFSDCGGVLKPPETGDSELEKPAPREGNTPVIPPGSVPREDKQPTPKSD